MVSIEEIIKNMLVKEVYKKIYFLPGYEKNVHKYLSNCKLFILSSLWEDPGFVLVEAMFSEH